MARGQPGEEGYRVEQSPTEAAPRRHVPEEQPSPVGGALEQVGEALDRKMTADSATWAGNAITNFRLDQQRKQEAARAAVGAGDPGDFTQGYLTSFDKDAQKLVDSAGSNPVAAAMLRHHLSEFRGTVGSESLSWEAHQRKEYQSQSLHDDLARLLPSITNSDDPETAGRQVGSLTLDRLNGSAVTDKLPFMRAAHQEITAATALGLVRQNPGAAYRELMKPSSDIDAFRELEPAARAAVLEHATKGTVQQVANAVVDTYRRTDAVFGQAAYASVDQLDLPAEMKDQIREEIHRGRGQLIAESQQANAPIVMKVEEALRSGHLYPGLRGDIFDGYASKNLYEPHVAAAYLGAVDALEEQQRNANAGMALIDRAWNPKPGEAPIVLDPKNGQQKTDAGNYFDALSEQAGLKMGSPEWINLGASFAAKTGVIPDSVGIWARSALVGSADPKQRIAAAETIDRMRSAAPRSFEYFDDDKRLAALADSINDLRKAGMADPLTVMRASTVVPPLERKRLDEKWKFDRPLGPNDTALTMVLGQQILALPEKLRAGLTTDSWAGRQTAAFPPEMESDYKRLTRSYYDNNGQDAKRAEASAARDIGTVWGISTINGAPEYMRRPPERMFPWVTPELVHTDLAAEIRKNPGWMGRWDEDSRTIKAFAPKPGDVKLIPDPERTELTGGRQWNLLHAPDGEAPEIIFGANGKPAVYSLPTGQADYERLRAESKAAADLKGEENRKAAEARYAPAREALERELRDAAAPERK